MCKLVLNRWVLVFYICGFQMCKFLMNYILKHDTLLLVEHNTFLLMCLRIFNKLYKESLLHFHAFLTK